ncbi:pre-60s factor [Stagonosporopsis vannaccii]|nr:pre-60s factor [Stagonosporopsis vannaccii]
MTATALGANLAATDTLLRDVSPQLQAGPRQLWPCSSCRLSFGTGDLQREHMKSPWHVYNLKRRIASLPPISLSVFEDQIQTSVKSPKTIEHHVRPQKSEEEHTSPPYQCLFCSLTFVDDDEGAREVIDHMFSIHGLFIPHYNMLSDPTSFLKYLGTQVRVWHECLYCGITRSSTLAIQDHMKDSSHCRLNFEKEPELSEFWECEMATATEVPVQLVSNVGRELRLASGKTATSSTLRQAASQTRRPRQTRLALTNEAELLQNQELSPQPRCRQVIRRDEQGIQNISPQQRHALMVAVKKSQKDEAMASRAREWTYARKANDQKHDQAHGPLSWAKGGMHNLLPR